MKIHEYQAREIFNHFGIPTNEWIVAESPDEVAQFAAEISAEVVVKAQVHVGGRGKAGGVKLAKTPEEAYTIASRIIGMDIKGLKVRKVIAARSIDIKRETYLGITIDRSVKKVVLIGTAHGGVEIEELARENPEAIHKIYVNPILPVQDDIFKEMGNVLFSEPHLARQAADILSRLYNIFLEKDCSLAEINPLVLDGEGRILAADAKINLDDNALWRHPELVALQDIAQENPKEIEAKKYGLSFVDLDGNIGCIVNGAGLAMATMDMIKAAGGQPANFLDVGGSSNPEKVLNAIRIVLMNPNVKVIVINIFGGITRCDDIAAGLIKATGSMEIPVPICVRLTGTNQERAQEMLRGTNLISADTMRDVIAKAVSFV
ncbi:MAG: ADP-forming succinate--CoA ligase subunit beta [Candidatus Sumerlaeota bacterium]|nr:ADP-forming succinate--CoA ligase subunit beta [Candidatus Sumerlaeota bacterium]